MKKIKNFFKKLNPMNAIENWVIKRFAKKLISSLPDFQNKGVDFVEENAEKLFQKIEIAIIQFVEKIENKQK